MVICIKYKTNFSQSVENESSTPLNFAEIYVEYALLDQGYFEHICAIEKRLNPTKIISECANHKLMRLIINPLTNLHDDYLLGNVYDYKKRLFDVYNSVKQTLNNFFEKQQRNPMEFLDLNKTVEYLDNAYRVLNNEESDYFVRQRKELREEFFGSNLEDLLIKGFEEKKEFIKSLEISSDNGLISPMKRVYVQFIKPFSEGMISKRDYKKLLKEHYRIIKKKLEDDDLRWCVDIVYDFLSDIKERTRDFKKGIETSSIDDLLESELANYLTAWIEETIENNLYNVDNPVLLRKKKSGKFLKYALFGLTIGSIFSNYFVGTARAANSDDCGPSEGEIMERNLVLGGFITVSSILAILYLLERRKRKRLEDELDEPRLR